jgi:hypothetical protein
MSSDISASDHLWQEIVERVKKHKDKKEEDDELEDPSLNI